MTDSTLPVLWLGPLAGWAGAMPAAVRTVDDPDAVRDARAALVVLASMPRALDDWIGRPQARPPVLVVTEDDAQETAALEAGADAVVARTAEREAAARAARHAIARHRSMRSGAELVSVLTASERRFRTVVRALPDVVSRLRTDGHVLDFHVPEAFATEFPAEALIGKSLPEEIPSDLADKLTDALMRLRTTGEMVTYDYAVESEGKTRYREVRMAPIGSDEVISILRDVTALRENEQALETSRAELRALAAHLQEVREDERTRLSREVHDVLGQQLTAIRLGVGWFGRHFPDDEAAQARLGDVRRTIDETIRHVRQIAADLRPGVLDDFGLAPAVEWQATRFEQRTDVRCRADIHGSPEPPPEVATAAFRVLQEALTNVARHADARSVALTLVLGPESVRLVVADDGRGFDPDRMRRQSLGLVGMRERVAGLGGSLDVTSTPGRGTRVECTFPHSLPTTP